MYSKNKCTFLHLFITLSILLLLVSCKDNSTSVEDPKESSGGFVFCGDPIKDTDGNTYQTILIGEQCWMAEDLRTTSYRDGTSIENVTEDNAWAGLSTGAWAYYANDDINNDINGKLYNWFAVNNSKRICPIAWKIPSDDDWKTLEIELGMTAEEANSIEWRGDGIGTKMRDENGFSASLGGTRAANGQFFAGGNNGVWWSSSEIDASSVWTRFLRSEFTQVNRNSSNKVSGYSVRCILS